jgi:predicted metal-dependent HD superfamily phosphohydrolase
MVVDAGIDRFVRLWNELAGRLGISDESRSVVGRKLLEAYSGKDRHYHDIRHILAMLDTIEQLEARFPDPDAARLAAFFHDVVYFPSRIDNERRSAELLASSLAEIRNDRVFGEAHKMIMATGEHRLSDDPSVDLFIDMDMSILAAPWPEYAKYAKGVMKEYVPVFGEHAYREGRVELFLRPILERGEVFVTDVYEPLNAEALKNLAREREILASGGRLDAS